MTLATRARGLAAGLLSDERGFVLSAELALVLTIGVLAMVVGVHAVAKSLNAELLDVASAFGTLNQSYSVRGFAVYCPFWGLNAATAGSGFIDVPDHCDCAALTTTGGWSGGRHDAIGGALYATPGPVEPTHPAPFAAEPCPAGWPCESAPPCPAGTDCPPGVPADGQPLRPLPETGEVPAGKPAADAPARPSQPLRVDSAK